MRLVIQRVAKASVSVAGKELSSIGRGLLVLCGVGRDDTQDDAAWLAGKTARLRIFEDGDGKMNLDLAGVNGEVLAVSQFTLYGNCRKGNRPSFVEAADPERGRELYEHYVDVLRSSGVSVSTGQFQAMMDVALVNDGPVTLVLDSAERRRGG